MVLYTQYKLIEHNDAIHSQRRIGASPFYGLCEIVAWVQTIVRRVGIAG